VAQIGRNSTKPSVFVSYSHKDKLFLEQLNPHLTHLSRQSLLTVWDDTTIAAGQKWRTKIDDALKSAKVAVLLISKYFLSSKFIREVELPAILAKQNSGAAILPLIVRPCRYEYDNELRELQAFNDPSKTVDEMTEAERERLFVSLSRTIDATLNKIRSETKISNTEKVDSHIVDKTASQLSYDDRARLILYKKRVEKYEKLWTLMEVLPKWPRSSNVRYTDLNSLSNYLRDWYFKEQGGLYLTRESHSMYSLIQESLTMVVKKVRPGRVLARDYDNLRDNLSMLRTELTEDLQTRRR
jgi:hypothetical protein